MLSVIEVILGQRVQHPVERTRFRLAAVEEKLAFGHDGLLCDAECMPPAGAAAIPLRA